jgi:hypothetical protein
MTFNKIIFQIKLFTFSCLWMGSQLPLYNVERVIYEGQTQLGLWVELQTEFHTILLLDLLENIMYRPFYCYGREMVLSLW